MLPKLLLKFYIKKEAAGAITKTHKNMHLTKRTETAGIKETPLEKQALDQPNQIDEMLDFEEDMMDSKSSSSSSGNEIEFLIRFLETHFCT